MLTRQWHKLNTKKLAMLCCSIVYCVGLILQLFYADFIFNNRNLELLMYSTVNYTIY